MATRTKPTRFGVFRLHVSQDEIARLEVTALAEEIGQAGYKHAAHVLGQLSRYRNILSVLQRSKNGSDASWWRAYHAVLCETISAGDRVRVAEFWSKSVETIQDDLTNHRRGVEHHVNVDLVRWRANFTPLQILNSFEETLLSSERERLKNSARARAARRKK